MNKCQKCKGSGRVYGILDKDLYRDCPDCKPVEPDERPGFEGRDYTPAPEKADWEEEIRMCGHYLGVSYGQRVLVSAPHRTHEDEQVDRAHDQLVKTVSRLLEEVKNRACCEHKHCCPNKQKKK